MRAVFLGDIDDPGQTEQTDHFYPCFGKLLVRHRIIIIENTGAIITGITCLPYGNCSIDDGLSKVDQLFHVQSVGAPKDFGVFMSSGNQLLLPSGLSKLPDINKRNPPAEKN